MPMGRCTGSWEGAEQDRQPELAKGIFHTKHIKLGIGTRGVGQGQKYLSV